MTTGRPCRHDNCDGQPCGAFAVKDSEFCFQHDPALQEKAQEARRAGGLRRRREKSVVRSFRLGDLRSFEAQWRLLEIAATDALELDNSALRIAYSSRSCGGLVNCSR